MGLFGNPRKNKDKWAKLVVTNAQSGMSFDEKFLDAAKDGKLFLEAGWNLAKVVQSTKLQLSRNVLSTVQQACT